MRRVIAALIVVGLAVGVILLWPRSANDEPVDTVSAASTTTSTVEPTSTTGRLITTPTDDDSHVVETVAEAEEILRDLWLGWFEGIYNQDEERIREVVVLEETVETAKESFGAEFDEQPRREDITFSNTEILRSDEFCLVISAQMSLVGFREGSSGGVHVVRRSDDEWKRLSLWRFEEDLWEADCESSLP